MISHTEKLKMNWMEIKIRIREHEPGPFEYLICSDSKHENFKLVKHWIRHRKVGLCLLDTLTGIQVFGNDDQLTLLGTDFVIIPPDVTRKVEVLKYSAISLWTMGEFDEVRLKMQELKLFLKVNYFVYSNQQN